MYIPHISIYVQVEFYFFFRKKNLFISLIFRKLAVDIRKMKCFSLQHIKMCKKNIFFFGVSFDFNKITSKLNAFYATLK